MSNDTNSFFDTFKTMISKEKEYSTWMKERNGTFRGVLGGLSKYLGLEPFLVKLVFFLSCLFFTPFLGVAAYFILNVFVLDDYNPEKDYKFKNTDNKNEKLGGVKLQADIKKEAVVKKV